MEAKLGFIFEFEKLIFQMKSKAILTKNGDFYKETTIRNYEIKAQNFKEYQTFLKTEIYLNDIDYQWCQDFHLFLLSKNYAKNTIFSINSVLLSFIRRMFLAKKIEYNGVGIVCKQEVTTAVYSTFEDLKTIYHLDLSKYKGLERTRDLYICQCFLGLRLKDMFRFMNQFLLMVKKIDGRYYFEIKTLKTGEVVVIPASPVVENIIKRRNFDFGKQFTQQAYSKNLKKVIRKAGIDRKLIFSRTQGGIMTHTEVFYSDLISTHTARRTFATNAYLSGLNPLDIMKITGHKTFQSFIRYIRCDNMAVALRISNHEFFNTNL